MAISRKILAAAVALCTLLCALAGAATASADPVNNHVPTVTMDPGGGVNFDITGAIPGRDVNVYLDGVWRWTYTADSSGNVTNAGPGGVPPGQHTLAAASVDGNHVESAQSTPVSFLLRPNRPHFAQLVIGVQVNQSQPPVRLTSVDPTASQVTLYENRIIGNTWTPVEIGAATTIGSDGTATVTPSAPLIDGPHTLIPSQTVNGYESNVDLAPHIQVRFLAAAPSLDAPADGTLSNNGQPSFSVSGALTTTVSGNPNVRVIVDE